MTNPNEMNLDQLGQLQSTAQSTPQDDSEVTDGGLLADALAEALSTPVQQAPLNELNTPAPTPAIVASTESTPKVNPALEVANATLDPALAVKHAQPVQAVSDEPETPVKPAAIANTDSDFGTPELEATVAEERQRGIDEGKTTQDINPMLDEMRKLNAAMNVQNDTALKTMQILENVSIDLDNIDIVEDNDTDPLELNTQVQLIEATRPNLVTPVIALKSGYKSDMLALTSMDKIDLRNLQGTLVDQTLKMLRVVHRKIADTSVGKLKFEHWLNITAEEDYDTLLYGIFAATFPKATEYTITCGHCGTKNNLKLFPTHLLEVVDRDNASRYVQQVLEGWNRGPEFLKESLVAKTKRIMLPKSKFVIELCTPTLKMMIDNLTIVQRMKQQPAEMVALTKYMKGMYIPNIQALSQGKQKFHAIADPLERLHHITRLDIEWCLQPTVYQV